MNTSLIETVWTLPLRDADAGELEQLLRRIGVLEQGETVASVGSAGEGNMNLVRRVVTDRRSVIVKHALPYVAKYPTIAAPADRAAMERAWYEAVAASPAVSARMPALLGGDEAGRALVLEDFGEAADLTTVYLDGTLDEGVVDALAAFLAGLHDATEGRSSGLGIVANRAMRVLNHAHIFDVPLQPDNGIALDSLERGLSEVVTGLRVDAAYREQVDATGRRYLADYRDDATAVLLHGDYFPGSWLATGDGVRVIDPEFGFFGPAAFDVAVATAHFVLAGCPPLAERFIAAYERFSSTGLDQASVARFAAAEVMRRLVGVAQLPLPDKPAGWRAGRLGVSREAMVSGRLSALLIA